MSSSRISLLGSIALVLCLAPLRAEELKEKENEPPAKTVEELAKILRPSIVVVTTKGRESRSVLVQPNLRLEKRTTNLKRSGMRWQHSRTSMVGSGNR